MAARRLGRNARLAGGCLVGLLALAGRPDAARGEEPRPPEKSRAEPGPAGYPLWDGKESVAQYARRTGLKPAERFDVGKGIGLDVVLIPPGKFLMGSPDTEKPRQKDETQHEVTISKPFYMGRYEVTQDHYWEVMRKNGSSRRGQGRPVEMVAWSDATAFCDKVGLKIGRTVRLPTEAEWEYACRAGTTTRFNNGDATAVLSAVAWHRGNSGGRPEPSGAKPPNAWDLRDTLGNVYEWCADWYDEKYYTSSPAADPTGPAQGPGRVARGGSCMLPPESCRSAARAWFVPEKPVAVCFLGFRVAVNVGK